MRQADWKIAGLFVVSVICMLWIGLDSRESDTSDGPKLSSHPGSLQFQGSGLAYTRPLSLPASSAPDAGFTLYLVLKPAQESLHRGLQFIASLSTGDARDQFVIAQWRNGLIVMSGDDYDYSRRSPRLETQIAISADQFVAISIGPASTTLMVDGTQVATLDSAFRLPAGQTRMRLTLGNALNSRNPWHGQISGFALVAPSHSASESIETWQQWVEHHQLLLTDPAAAGICFNFEDATESLVTDISGHGNDLLLTENRPLLHPEFASASLELSSIEDMSINVVGFIPFGFLLAWLLRSRKHYAGSRVLFVVVFCSGLLSGGIELTQAWLPARSSSLLDLLLNISGGGCGAVIHRILHRRLPGTDQVPIAESKDELT